MQLKKIGSFIAALRREKGMTQQELAALLYVSPKTVSRWENGNYAPPLDVVVRLSEIFGVTSDELLAGERAEARPEPLPQSEHAKKIPPAGSDSFSLNERRKYFEEKWLCDHRFEPIAAAVVFSAAVILGLALHMAWIIAFGLAALSLWSLIFRNRMMSYIERSAFDGRGSAADNHRQDSGS
ncbi:MAG: helix-turn-helix domain-containing protein [Oscillospiraceae bacterium]